ncbi:hypothetical protein F9802_06740 [Bacillus aerolatus]|uniref:SWIM-type domain-containing protein n=1 Tax=Bacillus aerolatus TaxID=2653354 RepID=A0A6I1FL08_9BACI|nr:hypothetical protein [Bacillus aerolatus]KAB7707444.1 hypothetical protein F9802_06740 [Bacillus aerolatus]
MPVHSEALKSQLDSFGAKLKAGLNPALPSDKLIMENGFRLYSVGRATVQQTDSGLIAGSVEQPDGSSFNVHLDLSFPSSSTCTCPAEHWCAHQTALFFEASRDFMEPVYDFLNDWVTTPQNPAAIPGVMRASDLLKTRTATDDGPDMWMKKITNTAQERLAARSVHKNPYIIEYEGRNLYEDLLKQRPAKREWQPLYELYVSFGLLTYMTDLFNETQISRELLHRACSSFLFYLVEEASGAAEDIGVHALPFEFDQYIGYLRRETAALLTPEKKVFIGQRIDLYRHLWTSLFKREAWRKEERMRLQTLIEEKHDLALSIGYLHQLYLANELEAFAAAAKSMPDTGVDLYLFWLMEAFSAKQYEKARMLVKIADEKLEGYMQQLEKGDSMQSRRFAHWFLTYIDTDWLMEKEPLLYKSLLERMLPYSYTDLSLYFIQIDQYREWVELQLWMDRELPELDRSGLKEAVKHAPEEVLPLFHHGILRLIDERNRASYKKAVRYLKRLRTLYKKLKRVDRWELYINDLLEEKKRLRAFQEECRKGQLTDA